MASLLSHIPSPLFQRQSLLNVLVYFSEKNSYVYTGMLNFCLFKDIFHFHANEHIIYIVLLPHFSYYPYIFNKKG